MTGSALDVITQIGAGAEQHAAAEKQKQQGILKTPAVSTILLSSHSVIHAIILILFVRPDDFLRRPQSCSQNILTGILCQLPVFAYKKAAGMITRRPFP
jgi:hypothetical protein